MFLGDFSASERPVLEDVLQAAALGVETVLAKGVAQAMNTFNARDKKAPCLRVAARGNTSRRGWRELAMVRALALLAQATPLHVCRWVGPAPFSPRGVTECRQPAAAKDRLREYEVVYVLAPNADNAEAERINNKVTEIVSKFGGKLLKLDNWGRRKLAYVIKKQHARHLRLREVRRQCGRDR